MGNLGAAKGGQRARMWRDFGIILAASDCPREEAMEMLTRKSVSRTQMLARVARFRALEGSDGGLPDSRMPGCERTLYNVIGFQPPEEAKSGVTSPVGEDAARRAAIP